MSSVKIVGTGEFGFALGYVLAGAGHDVVAWDRRSSWVERWREKGCCDRQAWMEKLPRPTTPIRYTAGDIQTAGFDFVVLATPMAGLPDVVANLSSESLPPIVCLQKGLDRHFRPPVQVVLDRHPNATTLQFTGAGFAKDIADGQQTLMAIGYPHFGDAAFEPQPQAAQVADEFRQLFAGTNIWPYLTPDIRGLCACGTARTVASICWGIVDGFCAVSQQTAIAAAAAAIEQEHWALVKALGTSGDVLDISTRVHRVARADLLLCRKAGRNWDFGYGVGSGASWIGVPAHVTIEGVGNLANARKLLEEKGQLEAFPYLDEAYKIVHCGGKIEDSFKRILDRHRLRFSRPR